jgi:hypothetical protein
MAQSSNVGQSQTSKKNNGKYWRKKKNGNNGNGNNNKDGGNNQPPNPPQGGAARVINVIHGMVGEVSNSQLKAKARQVPPEEPRNKRLRPDETITFSDADAVPNQTPHSDPMIIAATIGNTLIKRVFVDDGSGVEVMFVDCFDKLDIGRENLQKCTSPLSGFTGRTVIPLGQITLPVTVSEGDRGITFSCTFAVINAVTPFNVILGRPWMTQARAVWSPHHLMMKFPTDKGIASIRGDQATARSCMLTALKDARKVREVSAIHGEMDPAATEPMMIGDRGTVEVGRIIPSDTRILLQTLLDQYVDVFSWDTSDLTGVPRDLAEHKLNVDSSIKPVKQKRRHFAPERGEAIKEEVQKLLKADVIEETIYPEWIANPVMVKKHDGGWRMCIDFTDLNNCCPKDSYPLPSIDQLVEAISGFQLLAFFDAHKVTIRS